jgi:virginiamycin B lyase
MKRSKWLVVSAIVLTASACEQAGVPTATIESRDPSFAAGPSGRFRSFRIPTDGSQPKHIALGSDGAMWFTESDLDVSQIGRIDADGNITEFVVPTRGSQPSDIVAGSDGALWFTEPTGFPFASIGRITTDGQITEFNPCEGMFSCTVVPSGIASAPDGSIWFTESNRNAIGKLDPSTRQFTFYPIPTPSAGPAGITLGPDGALWFAEFHANRIGRITTSGVVTEFAGATGPERITSGPDGNLWYTSPFGNVIGRITQSGVITEFPIAVPSQPRDIVAGPDGNLWFTEYNADRLSQITPDGIITEVKGVRGGPWGIGRGVGNDLWIVQRDGNRVARFTLRE